LVLLTTTFIAGIDLMKVSVGHSVSRRGKGVAGQLPLHQLSRGPMLTGNL
jgi:hypothetical protein